MSLDTNDLLAIRQIVSELLSNELEPIRNQLTALQNDVVEIYDILLRNGISTV